VVFGGAVRDLLQGHPIHDLDVAVVLPEQPPSALRYGDYDCTFSIVPRARPALERLARVLGCGTADALAVGGVHFAGVEVDVLGLRPVFTADGQAYPDIFATAMGDTVLQAPGALTLNALALDARKRLYGK